MFNMVFPTSSRALLCIIFLMLGLFHRSFSELSSNCSVEEVKAERKASLTCMFSVGLQETKFYQIVVKHFKSESASTPDEILQCIHTGNEYVCPYKADNTTFDGNINRNLTIVLPAGKAYEGSYRCDIIPNTPVSSNMFKNCSFQLSKEPWADAKDNTGIIVGVIVGCVVAACAAFVVWRILKKKKSRAESPDDKVDMEPLQSGPIYKGPQSKPDDIQILQDEKDSLLQGKGDGTADAGGKDALETDVGPEDSEDKKKLGEESPKQEGYDSGQPGAGDRVKLRNGQSVLENPAVAEQNRNTDQDVHSRGNPVA